MENFYLVQMQSRGSKVEPTKPIIVCQSVLIDFINKYLVENSDIVCLISAVESFIPEQDERDEEE